MPLNEFAAIVTRDDIITFFSIVVSVIVALLAVPYAERWQRRRRSGEDYQYGLHLLQSLQHLQGDRRKRGQENQERARVYPWAKVVAEATDRINSSTDSPDYRPADKAHRRQLRKACYLLFQQQGVLPAEPSKLSTDQKSMEQNGWAEVEKQSWRISSVGSKVLRRTMERESKDEQYAVFERFYRLGDLPAPRAGEEHGHHHHEYLERILPSPAHSTDEERTVSGDFVVRADDEQTVGFLVRARVLLAEREETTFRYVECPTDESPPRIVTEPSHIRERVDKAWPPDGLAASRPQAHRILAGLVDSGPETRNDGVHYDIPALHYLAWNYCRDEIVSVWGSGADESALSFAVPAPLRDARDFLEELGDGLYDEQAATLNRSYPREIVAEVQRIMDSEDLDDEQRCEKLCKLIAKRDLARISLPSIQSSIRSDDVELEAWLAFLPP